MSSGATLVSVNVGMPKDVPWQGRTVHTGIWKSPVPGPAMVRRLNIDGDGQGDLNGHGGEQRAVFVYQLQSYEHWERYFGKDDREYGQFGENFTVDGLPDDEVCIGDRYRIGEAEFEVTQPRVTCYRVGMRLGQPELPALLVSHHRPGFYLRVITEGRVQAGDEIIRTRTGPGALSVAGTDALLYLPGHDPALLRRALGIPALSPGWQGSFRDLLAGAEAGSGAGSGPASAVAPAPAWAGFRPLRVTQIVPESGSVSSIWFNDPSGSPLPATRAGQYLTVRIPVAGGPAAVRSYSLSSGPGGGTYRISVKREPHGVASGYLDKALRAGDTLDAAAPRGDFVLDDSPGPVLLVSAGIGLTPVLAMLHDLAAQHSDRDIWWLQTVRSPQENPLAAEAHALLTALPGAHEHVFYSSVDGRLSQDKLAGLGFPADASAYVCGPAGFMADMRAALTALGVDPARIHTELFGALAPINPGLVGQHRRAPHPPGGPPGTGPQVTFARSGLAVRFDTTQPSVLDFADACDVPTRWSCRTGVCHTCVTPLLSGDIDYAPDPLEPPAAGDVLICCARPRTDIVLDLLRAEPGETWARLRRPSRGSTKITATFAAPFLDPGGFVAIWPRPTLKESPTVVVGSQAQGEPRPLSPAVPRGSEYALLSRRVRQAGLLARRPRHYAWKIALTAAALAAGWSAFALVGNSWWQLGVAAFLAIVFGQIGFLGHDAGHSQVFATRRANYVLGVLCGNLGIGLSYGWWTSKHSRHHAHPNTEDVDPDVMIGPLAFSGNRAQAGRGVQRLLFRYQAYLLVPLLFLEAISLHISSISALIQQARQRRTSQQANGRHWAWEAGLLTVHVSAYLCAVFLVLSPLRAVVFILVQQGLLGFYLGCSFAPNHKGMPVLAATDKTDFLRRQVLTSRNVRGGWLTDFALGGLNYQIEHHLFPSMPRPSLRRAQPLIAAFCAEHDLPYCQATLFGSYAQALRHLNAIGKLTRPAAPARPAQIPARSLWLRHRVRPGLAGQPRRGSRASAR